MKCVMKIVRSRRTDGYRVIWSQCTVITRPLFWEILLCSGSSHFSFKKINIYVIFCFHLTSKFIFCIQCWCSTLYALDEQNGLVLCTLCHTFGKVMCANKSIMIWFSQLVITLEREDPNTLHGSKKWEWILNTAWLLTTLSAKLISL